MKLGNRINHSKNNQEAGLFRDCQRFRPAERADEQTEEDAMVYLNLRKAGLKKEKALKFCLTQHCKIDSTQDIHGPPGFKIFKTRMDKFKMLQGWQLVGKLKYEEAVKFQAAKKDVELASDPHKDEQLRLQQLKLYYTTLDEKYSLQNLNQEEMANKLRSFSTEESHKSRTPRYQLKNKNQIYYELADQFKSRKLLEPTLITELEAFDDMLTRDKRDQLHIEPKVIDKVIRQYKETNMERRSKLLKELSLTYRGRMTIDEPQEDNVKMAIRKYYKQEFNQSNYMSKLSDNASNSLVNSLNDFEDSSMPKRRCSIISHRFSKFMINDEILKINRFRTKLDELVKKGLKKMYGEAVSPLVARKFR